MFKKDIVVYWSPKFFPEDVEISPAVRDLHIRLKNMSGENPGRSLDIAKCPVAVKHFKNTFAVSSPVTYDLTFAENNVFTTCFDQDFYNNNVIVRDINTRLISLLFGSVVFFTEEDSLIMEMRNASYSPSAFNTSTTVLEGSIDIGRYFRFTDLAFFMNSTTTVIEKNNPMYYVKFHSDKKIILKKFLMDEALWRLYDQAIESKKAVTPKLKKIPVWERWNGTIILLKSQDLNQVLLTLLNKT